MNIDANTFLNIFYSIMNNDDIYSIDIIDIVEVLKIVYSSSEFKMVSTRINLNEYNEDVIKNHKYTNEIDEDGIVCFEVPKEERAFILKNNGIDAGLIQQAINKRAIAKYLESEFNGDVELKYENPNGLYSLYFTDEVEYKAESKIFSDGNCVKDKVFKNYENNTITRSISINDATFSLLVSYIDGIINKIEARGDYRGSYSILLYEIKRLLSGIDDSFKNQTNDSPQVYKYKVH